MLLKTADDKSSLIRQLESLQSTAPAEKKKAVDQALLNLRAGIKAEKEAAYLLDFALAKSKNTAIIHDLRLEVDGRVAQIDHLLLHRTLNIFVLETKHLHAGFKVTEEGEFLSWNAFRKCYEGMPSPLAQNERHIKVLKDALGQIELPGKLGLRLAPAFHSYVLVSSRSRIDRPEKFDTSRIVKADQFSQTLDAFFDKIGFSQTLAGLARYLSTESLARLGQRLIQMHRPASFDPAAHFGLTSQAAAEKPLSLAVSSNNDPPAESAATISDFALLKSAQPEPESKPICRKCKSSNLAILYGKYGYYFKCSDCSSNTPIRLCCQEQQEHTMRLRKDGRNFYQECKECGSSELFFVNQD
ncbi:nuclease-related domain-containing protein [Desulfuromonas thiophila]|uniref:nuclease-related domain-containing protein n=1 Tax=Desulfuromonas thiophila TaxID=57664 RepID=UPI0029F467A1|nr:nuclease-related domain-containing protein [Desulfuromonas thiophila]